ncbi:MgtC/SapB family protein [Ramlibacter tataouinensis]|uniref:MgtC/SapB family protein n=1 Tax=Ramlibacter tataouinensis TaxID=94132 RepID=UPI0022F37EBA|nr:MgtC/SapB family protein [Ramlibacter tataouinensis]WBY03615.1 MgtC/SapB family protein [Ramlibacter tataouinensis]
MDAWNRVLATVADEFSDLPDVETFTRVAVRLVLAALLGALVGLERELAGKPAGLRTHMLVALGAALFVLIPLQGGMDTDGISRVIQGLLAGVGFLCAGAILKGDTEDEVQGLTTAASLWMTSAIGMGVGLGRDTTAALATVLVLAILRLEGPLRRWIEARRIRRVVVRPDDAAGP